MQGFSSVLKHIVHLAGQGEIFGVECLFQQRLMLFQCLDAVNAGHVCVHSIPVVRGVHTEQGEDESEFHGSGSDDCVDEFEEQNPSQSDEGRDEDHGDEGD
jgi:hypothetical protein